MGHIRYWSMATSQYVHLGSHGDRVRFVFENNHFGNSIEEKEILSKPSWEVSAVIWGSYLKILIGKEGIRESFRICFVNTALHEITINII